MFEFNLVPDTPFPTTEIKEYLQQNADDSPQCINIDFYNAEKKYTHRGSDGGKFSMQFDHKGRINIVFNIHNVGGRERFLADVGLLHRVLVESGGFVIDMCYVFTSTCCDDLIADALHLFSTSSHNGINRMFLNDRDGDADPTALERIVSSALASSKIGSFSWSNANMQIHPQCLNTLFHAANIHNIHLGAAYINVESLVLIAQCLRNSQENEASQPVRLSMGRIPPNAMSDGLLAEIVTAGNGILRSLNIYFEDKDGPVWIAEKTLAAFQESNFTIEDMSIYPPAKDYDPYHGQGQHPSYDNEEEQKKWSKQKQWLVGMEYMESLNMSGRGAMRGCVIPPDVLVNFLKVASLCESHRPVPFPSLFPILLETVSGWIGYLVKPAHQPKGGIGTLSQSEVDPVVEKCRARLAERAEWKSTWLPL